MSFSKAKIQRFNERGSEAPPPGAYDPKFDTKIKSFTIEKKERFNDNRSVASSGGDCSKSVSSRDAAPIPSPKFRTPQLPKKRITKPTSAGCSLTKTRIPVSVKQLKYDATDELADLKVECANKDITIREHEKYIDEMKSEILKLEKELSNLNDKQADIEEQHRNDIEAMVNLQQGILNNREEKHNDEVNSLKNQLITLENEKTNEISKLLTVENENKILIHELMEKIKNLENNLSKKEEELEEKNVKIEELKNNYESQLNELKNNEEKNTIAEKDNELLDAYTEMSQLKNNQEDLQVKLSSMEESRNFFQSEYNCLQKKIELLEEIQYDLENTLEAREHIVDNLQCQLLSVQNELDKLKTEHEQLIDDYEKQISDLIDEHTMELARNNVENIRDKNGEKENECLFINNALSRELHDFQLIYEDVKLGMQEIQVSSEDNTGEMENKSGDDDPTKLQEIEEIYQNNDDDFSDALARAVAEKNQLAAKLVEREAEISQLAIAFNNLTCATATQESFCQSLQEELDRAEVELTAKKVELKEMKQEMREEAAKLVSRRRRLEVIMEENQATVAALSARLADSNVEIERLQNELQINKDLVQEYRDSLEALQKSSTNVNENVQLLMKQVEEKKDIIEDLEITSIADIESLKTIFEEKIDELKETSELEISKIVNACLEKDHINEKLKEQLDEMADKLCAAQDMLLILEEQSDTQCIEISQLQLAREKLNHLLKGHATEMSDTKNHFDNEIEKHKIYTKEGEDRINHLVRKIELMKKDLSHYESVKLSMEEHIRTLEQEKSLRKIAEEKINKLTESNQRLHKNYQEMKNKYTEIISSHNEKQEAKNYNKLQDKLKNLEKDLQEKSHLLEQQLKTIERLQSDERKRSMHIKGKENLSKSQISKSPFSTPVSSPHKPLTPLRDRND